MILLPESMVTPIVDGFTPEQRFFLAYANVWAGNIRPEEILRLTKLDPHSLGKWRVDGALPHIANASLRIQFIFRIYYQIDTRFSFGTNMESCSVILNASYQLAI